MSLLLPWELIEMVIDHSSGLIGTLRNFALTCRQLYPRSTAVLLDRLVLYDREKLFALCAVLQAKPHLQTMVRSIRISAHEFSPHPLLRILHNLSDIEFVGSTKPPKGRTPPLHPSVLKSCHLLGKHIKTLSFDNLQLTSLQEFSRILLSFPNIRSLACLHLKLEKGGLQPEELTKQRIVERLHLKTLAVDEHLPVAAFMLLAEVTKPTIESLSLTASNLNGTLDLNLQQFLLTSPPSASVALRSFTLHINLETATTIQHIVALLKHSRPPTLREVTLCFCSDSIVDSVRSLNQNCYWWKVLEQTLLTFLQPHVRFSFKNPTKVRPFHSWTNQVERWSPLLVKRGALTTHVKLCKAGHDGRISTSIITSPDGRLVATGSEDGTIIVWDLNSGSVSKEWFAHRSPVGSLAFSPNGQFIVSAGTDGRDLLWTDIICDSPRSCQGMSFGERDDALNDRSDFRAPDDDTVPVAIQFNLGIVHFLNGHTFNRMLLHGIRKARRLAYSADGRWIAIHGQLRFHCNIWNATSGQLHSILCGHTDPILEAAFDSSCTRVATASSDNTVRIWDVGCGEELHCLRTNGSLEGLAYSPDGKLVLAKTVHDERGQAFPVHTIWEASSGTLLGRLDASTDGAGGSDLCFSPCGRYSASVCEGGAVRLWRTSDWSCIARVSKGATKVTHVAISADGKMLCCGEEDGTIFFRRMCDLVGVPEDCYFTL